MPHRSQTATRRLAARPGLATPAHPLFVYGTLRQGFRNHHLLADAPCLGSARTKGRFAMYAHGVPYVVLTEHVSQIVGEVYQVDALGLVDLDIHEGHPRWYRRVLVDVTLDGGKGLQAWLYSFGVPRGELVPSGDYADAQ